VPLYKIELSGWQPEAKRGPADGAQSTLSEAIMLRHVERDYGPNSITSLCCGFVVAFNKSTAQVTFADILTLPSDL